ncbi:MAG TPA: lmo0937 family membrane protein [Gracilimonas sp.]|nr:lmo0937 family membrane protein [Gracilimonas sp.]
MRTLLYIIACLMVIGWIIGVVGYSLGGLIHALIVIAIIAVLFDLIRGRRPV